jgi:ABC-2 type transport system permease protein
MTGFLPWTFFTLSLSTAVTVIVDNQFLIKKVYFPREILPLSVVLFNLVQFLLTLLVLWAASFLFKNSWGFSLISLPLIIGLQTLFTTGIALILSSVHVYFRDTKHLVDIFLQTWFWLTPITYPFALVPDPVKVFFKLNPMTLFVIAYRDILLNMRFPEITLVNLLILWSLGMLLLGYWFFNKYDMRIVENI